jgi:hypothetical protein
MDVGYDKNDAIYPIFLSGLFPIGTWDAMEEK